MHALEHDQRFSGAAPLPVPGDLYWREEIIQKQYGLDCRTLSGTRFQAEMRGWGLGCVRIADMHLCGHAVASERRIAPGFDHDHVFLKVVADGAVVFEQAGDMVTVERGGLVLVDPERRFVERFPVATHLVVVCLPKRSLRERGIPADLDRILVRTTSSPDTAMLWHLLLSITQHSQGASAALRARVGEQVLDLAETLTQPHERKACTRTTEATRTRVKAFIKSHVGDPDLDADAIAAAAGLSKRHINRLFEAEGTSLMRYLWSARLARAHAMLDSGADAHRSIDEISWRCGFADLAHFSRSFKRRFGLSPREFRRVAIQRGSDDKEPLV